MATLITKRGNGVPTAANLVEGEQAIDLLTGRVYTLSGGVVIECGADPHVIDFITDVDTTTTAPADGEVLTFDGATNLWKPAAVSGGAVDKPYIIDPTNSQTEVSPSGPFEATTFGSNVGSVHLSSNWVIYSDAALSTVAYQVNGVTGTERTILTTASGLAANTTYYIQVTYNDNLGNISDPSNVVSFTTAAVGVYIDVGPVSHFSVEGPSSPRNRNTETAFVTVGGRPRFWHAQSQPDQGGVWSPDFVSWGGDKYQQNLQSFNINNGTGGTPKVEDMLASSKNGTIFMLGSAASNGTSTNFGYSLDGGQKWNKTTTGGRLIKRGAVSKQTGTIVGAWEQFPASNASRKGTGIGRILPNGSFSVRLTNTATTSGGIAASMAADQDTGDFVITFHGDDAGTFVNHHNGTFRSTDDGLTWTSVFETPEGTMVNSYLQAGDVFLSGVFTYGFASRGEIFRRYNTTNGTNTTLVSGKVNLGLPKNNKVYYLDSPSSAIVTYGPYVCITRDNGASWTDISDDVLAAVGGTDINAFGSDGDYFYACGYTLEGSFLNSVGTQRRTVKWR